MKTHDLYLLNQETYLLVFRRLLRPWAYYHEAPRTKNNRFSRVKIAGIGRAAIGFTEPVVRAGPRRDCSSHRPVIVAPGPAARRARFTTRGVAQQPSGIIINCTPVTANTACIVDVSARSLTRRRCCCRGCRLLLRRRSICHRHVVQRPARTRASRRPGTAVGKQQQKQLPPTSPAGQRDVSSGRCRNGPCGSQTLRFPLPGRRQVSRPDAVSRPGVRAKRRVALRGRRLKHACWVGWLN